MKVSYWIAPVASVVLLFGSVGVAQLTGDWVTTGRAKVVQGAPITVDDLKGWMTLQEAADGLGMSVTPMITLIAPPASADLTPETAFKDIEGLVPGFELSTFKEQLRAYLADSPSPTPVASSAPTPMPSSQPTSTPTTSRSPDATASHVPGATGSVTGQSTLAGVALSAGIDLDALIRESGLPADVDTRTPLKELRDSIPGFEIQQVRDAVTRLS